MEQTELELEHHNVHREDFISDIHYQNEVEFYNDFDELVENYDFLFDVDNYWNEIPEDTIERYELFKKSAGQYYFLEYRREFRDLTLCKEIKGIVSGFYKECKMIIDDPMLSEENLYDNGLYLNATRFINEFVTKKRKDAIDKYSKNDVEKYLYLLHREEYFNTFPIPDDAFDINKGGNPYSIIAEVYARYFPFFERCIDPSYKKLTANKEPVDVRAIRNKYVSKLKNESEERTVFEIINPNYKNKFDKVFQVLAHKNPLATVADNFKMDKDKRSDLLKYGTELSNFQTILVRKIAEDKLYINDSFKNLKTFLCYLFAYMRHKEWIDAQRKKSFAAFANIISDSIVPCNERNEIVDKKLDLDPHQLNTIFNSIERGLPKMHGNSNSYMAFIEMLMKSIT